MNTDMTQLTPYLDKISEAINKNGPYVIDSVTKHIYVDAYMQILIALISIGGLTCLWFLYYHKTEKLEYAESETKAVFILALVIVVIFGTLLLTDAISTLMSPDYYILRSTIKLLLAK